MENEKYRQKVGITIFSFLDSFNETEKAELLGKLFSSCVIDRYNYNIFIEFANVLEDIMISDIKLLKFLYKKRDGKYYLVKNKIMEKYENHNEVLKFSGINRLINLNLINNKGNVVPEDIENPEEDMDNGYFSLDDYYFAVKINVLGKLFYESIM